MRCTVCGAELMPGAAFCTRCGTPVTAAPAAPASGVRCPTCGAVVPEGYAFCTKCGTPLSAPVAPAPVSANRCPTCGAEVPEGYAFCTKCGTPVPAQGGRQQGFQQQSQQQGGFAVPAEPEYPPEAYAPVYEEEEPKRKSNWLLWTILGIVAALVIAAVVLYATGFFDGDKDKDKDEDDEKEAYSDTVKDEDDEDQKSEKSDASAEPDEDEEDADGEDKDKASESGKDASEDTETLVTNTVVAYFDAFIKDVNSGSYGALNAVVQHGSQVETEQKKFIEQGNAKNLREELLDYTILSATKQSDTCWRVTTEEKYEIWQNIDPTHWWTVQRCTYLVYLQSDGTWKVAELTDWVPVDHGNY